MKKGEMTEWFGPEFVPYHVGVYNASVSKNKEAFRYWNGDKWSAAWYKVGSKATINHSMLVKSISPIYFRGFTTKQD